MRLPRPGPHAAVVTQDKCLLFEPNSPSSRKFLEIVMPKIQAAGECEAFLLHC